jgi:hypothetical protein
MLAHGVPGDGVAQCYRVRLDTDPIVIAGARIGCKNACNGDMGQSCGEDARAACNRVADEARSHIFSPLVYAGHSPLPAWKSTTLASEHLAAARVKTNPSTQPLDGGLGKLLH